MTIIKRNIVIEINTLGKRNDAAITQIGVVIADSNFEVQRKELIQIAPEAWGTGNRTFTGKTLLWWIEQKVNPFSKNNTYYCSDYYQALHMLSKIFIIYNTKDSLVYTKGIMDLSCLKDLYEYLDGPIPWAFSQLRDIRTIKESIKKWEVVKNDTHDALEDALNELKELKINLKSD